MTVLYYYYFVFALDFQVYFDNFPMFILIRQSRKLIEISQ